MLTQRTEIEYVKELTNHSKLKTYLGRALVSVLSAFLLGCPGKISEVNIFSSQSTESPDCLLIKKDNKWGIYAYSPTDEEFELKTELTYKDTTELQSPSNMTMANGIIYFKAAVSSVTKLFGYKEN